MQMCDKYGKLAMKLAITSSMMRADSRLSLASTLINVVENLPNEVLLRAKVSKRTRMQGTRQKKIEKS